MDKYRCSCFLILMLCVWPVSSAEAQGARGLKATEITTNMEQAHEGINDYTVTLDVVADLERVSVQPMHATMYFKKPDKVHFESKGFFLLPREGMIYNVGALRSHYTVEEPAVKETLNGESVYRITLVPKAEQRRSIRLIAFVHPARWTLEKIVSEPGEGRRFSGTFRYVRSDRWWLPAEITLHFTNPQPDSAATESPEPPAPVQRPQMPRAGTVTIRYTDYRVNSGLSDDLFSRSDGTK